MKQILCFGDSNTYGLIPATHDRYDSGIRWTGILSDRVRRLGYQVVEEGLCGRTTVFDDPFRIGRRGTELLPVILETHAPIDIVTVMLGTNDCKTINDASEHVIGLGIKKIIDQIKSFDSNIKILLISPIWLGDDVWDGYDPEFDQKSVETSKQLGNVYEQIARSEQITFLRASDYVDPSKEDREHLDREGHSKLAAGIFGKLQSLL